MAALRQTWRGSLEPAPKTDLLPPFGGRWTAANDTSESAFKQALKRSEKAELLKHFVLKLFRPAHLILNTPRM
jgi:hypothetical protein